MKDSSNQSPPTYEEACQTPTTNSATPSRASNWRNLVLRSRSKTHNTSTSTTISTPTAEPTEKSPQPPEKLQIKELASKTPQCLWPQTECKEWLQAVFVYYLNYPEEHSEEIAARTKGFGPSIFARTKMDWVALLGNEANGSAIYALVFSFRREEGAVPEGISFGHWNWGFLLSRLCKLHVCVGYLIMMNLWFDGDHTLWDAVCCTSTPEPRWHSRFHFPMTETYQYSSPPVDGSWYSEPFTLAEIPISNEEIVLDLEKEKPVLEPAAHSPSSVRYLS